MRKVFCQLALAALLGFGFLQVSAQQKVLTLDDTLRGSIGPERSWWDVTYYNLNLKVDPERKFISGYVDMNYLVLSSGNKLQIDLQPPLILEAVKGEGRNLEFEKKGNNAYFVRIPYEQLIGKTYGLRFIYSGHPHEAKNPPWDGGTQFTKDSTGTDFIATSCQGLGASIWWPNKDHSYDEPDSVTMNVTVPQPLIDVSNGRLIRKTDNPDGTSTFTWHVSKPINNYGVNLNIASYAHFSDTLRGEAGVLDLDYYVLPHNLNKAKEQFKQAKLMLRAFEYWFGPYPFYEDGYKLVETPYLGMEHQSSVTYGNGYKNGYRGRDLSGTGWGLKWDFIIIHESGHEWFANNITYQDIADMWIHESFTNYSETLFTEYYYGKEAGTDYNVGTRRDIKNDKPIIGVYNVNQAGSGDMYPKGGNMLHTIRHAVNDDGRFRRTLRGLNEKFRYKTVTTKQVEDYMSEALGIKLGKVFDQYLRDTRIPIFEYYVAGRKLHFRWTNCVDGFDLPVQFPSGKQMVQLKPSSEWNSIRLKDMIIDAAYLQRMYYITIKPVESPK